MPSDSGGGWNGFSLDKISQIESFEHRRCFNRVLNLNLCFIDDILFLLHIVGSIDAIYLWEVTRPGVIFPLICFLRSTVISLITHYYSDLNWGISTTFVSFVLCLEKHRLHRPLGFIIVCMVICTVCTDGIQTALMTQDPIVIECKRFSIRFSVLLHLPCSLIQRITVKLCLENQAKKKQLGFCVELGRWKKMKVWN